MAIDRASLCFLFYPSQKQITNLVEASACEGVVAGHRSAKKEERSVERTGERRSCRRKTLLQRSKRCFVFARASLFQARSLSSPLREQGGDTYRWRPLYSSRLRRRRPAVAAPAAAGLSRQQQHRQLGRRALTAAAAAKAGGNELDHAQSPPPLRILLLRPRPPPTCAPPRRVSSAMRASSSGTRRWYLNRERERRVWGEKRERREIQADSAIRFVSSNLLLDLDLDLSPSLPPSLNATPRTQLRSTSTASPRAAARASPASWSPWSRAQGKRSTRRENGEREGSCLSDVVFGVPLFFSFDLLSLSLPSLTSQPRALAFHPLPPPLRNTTTTTTTASRTASPSA